MKFKHWVRYLLWNDTTWHGQLATLLPLVREVKESQRIVVDVGANDGFYSSNSYPFIKRGWKGVLIEPHPGAFQQAVNRYAGNRNVVLLNVACSDEAGTLPLILFAGDDGGSRSTLDHPAGHFEPDDLRVEKRVDVEVQKLADILARESVPQDFGFLSIDAEGQDLRVLKGLNLARFQPKVILTENNPSDELKFAYLSEHGYRLKAEVFADTIWVRT